MYIDVLRVIEFNSLPSTNDYALDIFKRKYGLDIWVKAQHQTQGRGTRGRSWVSGKQNLFVTCLKHTNIRIKDSQEISLLAGVALIRTVNSYQKNNGFWLKWPNDLMYENSKVGGILSEFIQHQDITGVICGFGVNIANAPNIKNCDISCLWDCGINVSINDFFYNLQSNFDQLWEQSKRVENFTFIKSEWEKSLRMNKKQRKLNVKSYFAGSTAYLYG